MSTSGKCAIWKTPLYLRAVEVTQVALKKGARPIELQLQRGIPTVWWIVDPDADLVQREIFVVGTGFIFPEGEAEIYIGTWQEPVSPFVWHAFAGPEI